MNESYAEAGCKKKATIGTYLIKTFLVLFSIILFFLTYQSYILLVLSAVIIVGIMYLFPRFNLEYEYIFCDGQLDFDKIYGNVKRKTAQRIDFEHVEICAPIQSHALDSYVNKREIQVKNYSSKSKDAKPYAIIVHEQDKWYKIIFEPNEKMIACMKAKAPRKVVEY